MAEKYKWLEVQTDEGAYLDPRYYSKILKKYVFNGKDDLEFLKDAVKGKQNINSALEFGCGPARATEAFLEILPSYGKLDLVDASISMLEYSKAVLSKYPNINTIQSDIIDFINSTDNSYDFIFSLWSLSHSVHQHLKIDGLENGKSKIEKAFDKLFTKVLNKNGTFFLMHFDSLSDEQRPSIKQRKKDNPIFTNSEQQSPSKLILDKVLDSLQNDKVVKVEHKHLIGELQIFENTEEVLEYYMNFHMESHFNQNKNVEEILDSLQKDLEVYKNENGTYSIKPGCFVYNITRLV